MICKETRSLEIPALSALLAAVQEIERREKRSYDIPLEEESVVKLPCFSQSPQQFTLPNIFEGVN
jgi:hypothetical protein